MEIKTDCSPELQLLEMVGFELAFEQAWDPSKAREVHSKRGKKINSRDTEVEWNVLEG